MSLAIPLRPICRSCSRAASQTCSPVLARGVSRQTFGSRFSSSSTAPHSSSSRWGRSRIALTFLGITIPTSYFFFPSSASLTPHLYSDQKVSATEQLTPQHKLLSVRIPSGSREYFDKPYNTDGSYADVEHGEVIVQHMMIKSPDIQIERPYTPINDPVADGEVRMVVKRVRGGEVGRVVHSLKAGDQVGIRGPIPTFSIYPGHYDRIVMISTGTAISPFLQLLSKLPSTPTPSSSTPRPSAPSSPTSQTSAVATLPPSGTLPHLHLIHATPIDGRIDWASEMHDPSSLPSLASKFGDRLTITRIQPGQVRKEDVVAALSSSVGGDSKDGDARSERVMVLVCLPPSLMRPLCGGMTPSLRQGPLTGLLAELGLTAEQVWKLE